MKDTKLLRGSLINSDQKVWSPNYFQSAVWHSCLAYSLVKYYILTLLISFLELYAMSPEFDNTFNIAGLYSPVETQTDHQNGEENLLF